MTDPIMDLAEDTAPRPWIRGADGSQHYLQTLDDLGLNARGEITRAWERVNAIAEKAPKATKAEEREYDALYIKLVRLMLPSLKQREVKALGVEQREAIVQAFFTHRTAHRVMQRMLANAATPSVTGSLTSPSSSGTTDEPPSEAATGEMSP